jgi:hypothetical protein
MSENRLLRLNLGWSIGDSKPGHPCLPEKWPAIHGLLPRYFRNSTVRDEFRTDGLLAPAILRFGGQIGGHPALAAEDVGLLDLGRTHGPYERSTASSYRSRTKVRLDTREVEPIFERYGHGDTALERGYDWQARRVLPAHGPRRHGLVPGVTDTLGHTVSDLVPLAWWEHLEERESSPSYEATLRFATALVQDGVSRVTVLIPRAPGVLLRARLAARAAGVAVRADQVASTTITLRFLAD